MVRSPRRLVTRLRPGNANLEALPPVDAGGRASKTAFPGGSWERVTRVTWERVEQV